MRQTGNPQKRYCIAGVKNDFENVEDNCKAMR